MKYKKIMLILITAIFLVSIAGVCAADANDTTVASDDANQMELSSNNEITEDNLKTSEENNTLTQANDAESDSQILSEGEGTYYDLRNEIGSGGDKNLAKSYYSYTGGNTIEIKNSGVINGNGAVIDMAGSNIRAFYVTASGVTIKDLTIKNANYTAGSGGAIYFKSSGAVENCNFLNNTADDNGGAINFVDSGIVTNCNFTENKASLRGGAVYFSYQVTVTNCNFTNNSAKYGGAIRFDGEGTVTNCNFTGNQASDYGGAVHFWNNGDVTNCNFTGNTATWGNAIYINNKCTISDCDFTNNPITKGAIHSVTGDITFSNNIINVDDVVSDKNFTEIQKLIDRANDGDEITINGLYAGFGIPIRITKSLTLNGQNNTTLDAKKLSKILYITANNVIIKNIQFSSGYADYGGAIYFSSTGTVTNCNFTNNSASDGGAVNFNSNGEVTNCNFTGNTANCGGAVYFNREGTVTNCNFTNNKATGPNPWGGAIMFWGTGNVTNCNFTDNSASEGGAVNFKSNGEVTNCNFTGNSASDGGAVYFDSDGNVTNCNFTNNKATGPNPWGGAIMFWGTGNVTNCNFADNSASRGGAVYFNREGTVTNCNFADNSANRGGAIYSYNGATVVDTCIFKANSGENVKVVIYPPTLNVDNFTTFYGSDEKLTFDLKTNSSIPVTNGNISISVYFKDDNSWVGNYSCLSGEGWAVSLPVGSYYANFTTEYEGFQAISRTITITIPNVMYYINVTSLATNNKTVNITAKSDIPKDILWNGKLLFILPNSTEINANYAGNGTWWALHTFDSAGDYSVNASYIGLDNVTINNATISITKSNSIVNLTDVVLNYGDTKNVTATVEGAIGITAMIDNNPVSIINNYTIPISGLAAGTYTLTVTTIADADHNPVTRNVTVTVNRAKTELTADAIITTYSVSKDLVITLKDSNDRPLSGLNITVDLNGTKNYTTDTNGQVKIPTNGLAANIYDVLISFNGTDNYLNSSNTTTVSIYKESSRVDTKPLTTDYNVHKYLVVGLKDNEGNPIRNADAFIEIHGVTYKCRSDDAGDARLIIRLNPGTYTAKITFDNVNYTGFTQYVTVIVKKLTPKLTAKKKTFKKSKKVKKYTVTLKANNKALAKVKLTLKVKGKTYKAKTNSKGKAVFKIKNLKKKGKYRATVRFKGNTYYNKVTKKVKITVK